MEPKEKIRATVVGAGIHSVRLSGSTIIFDESILPMKNIPIIKIFNNQHEDLDCIYENARRRMSLFLDGHVAVAFKGPKAPTYLQIKKMAGAIVKAFESSTHPIIVIVENDFAKALGQTMRNLVKGSKKVICIDNIVVNTGDYIDIGKPLAGTVPVVIKTLIFKN
jgi:ethanolamine utilization protein EutA